MGACGSQPAPVAAMSSAEKSDVRIAVVTDKKQAVFDQLVAENKIPADMLKMFQGALGNLEKYNNDLAQVAKEELKAVFPSVDMATFEHVYSLFTWGKDKRVDPKEFTLTVSMLACPIKDTATECVLIFTIFDPDGSGSLDRQEFGSLMKATIMSKVRHGFCGVRLQS
ncbi:hypothetical protein TrRE_jg6642 [Triparma retinervis]|uniref:EF-hand domain-containing protein n=1 Tax=Triparma retinervis TaxID=2557542 RepID=A0A9W7AP61_9STRA|nr:hypothetical protein TrRE_jg6642 [Triparma retinervis]